MPETLVVPDVSEFQKPLAPEYDRPAVIMRAAFGSSKQDSHFEESAAIAAKLWKAGKLRGGVVAYQVPVPKSGSAQEHFDFLWKVLGHEVPEWLTGVMIDVESWPHTDYQMAGDHSDWLNSLYSLNARKFNSWSACKGYFNADDGASLWPHRDARCEYTLAKYSSELVQKPRQVAQQYTDGSEKWPVPHGLTRESPVFGACDHNAFFGITDGAGFRRLWGRPVHPADAGKAA